MGETSMSAKSTRINLVLFLAAIVLSYLAKGADPPQGNLYPIEEGGKWGYIDCHGTVVIRPQFDGAKFFPGKYGIITINHRVGFIDRTGKVVIPPQFVDARNFSDQGVAPVLVDVSREYAEIEKFFYRFLAPDRLEDKWGLINIRGEFVVPPIFSFCGGFYDGLALVILDGNTGYMKADGGIQIPPKFRYSFDFYNGLTEARIGGFFTSKAGAIDVHGNFQVPPEYDGVGLYSEGLVPVTVGGDPIHGGGKCGFVDGRGKPMIPIQYDSAWWFSDGLAPVLKNGRWGYIDHQGQYAIPAEFEEAAPFINGIAIVRQAGWYAGIDIQGKIVFRLKADVVDGFYDRGLARVEIDKKVGIIDKKGHFFQKPVFDDVVFYPELIKLQQGQRWKYIDYEGREIFVSK